MNVGTPCASDINGDGTTNTLDLGLLLGRFGQSDTRGVLGDLNADNTVNSVDMGLLLAHFGQPCAGSACIVDDDSDGGDDQSFSMLGRSFAQDSSASDVPPTSALTPPGPVIAALGFDSVEAYDTYLSQLSDSELQNHIAVVLALIHDMGY